MKKSLPHLALAIILCFSVNTVKAVTPYPVPDGAFATWLAANYIGCMIDPVTLDGDWPGINTTTTVNVATLGIADLAGIEAFVSLTNLDCSNNSLVSLNLGSNLSLTSLICNTNNLLSLDVSANTLLTTIDCNDNNLTYLNIKNGNNQFITTFDARTNGNLHCITVDNPSNFDPFWSGFKDATAIFYLDCACIMNPSFTDANFFAALLANPLVNTNGDGDLQCYEVATFPGPLSVSNASPSISDLTGIEYFVNINTLNCSGNSLTYLDASLCTNLSLIDCSNNSITNIPALPPSLSSLLCSVNQLTSLPALPGLMDQLGCDNNKLASLPALPNLMRYLDCTGNLLTGGLPTLPSSLLSLLCSGNAFVSQSLPALPASLETLQCMGCNLASLPTSWPSTLGSLWYSDPLLTSMVQGLPNSLYDLVCPGMPGIILPNPLPTGLHSLSVGGDALTSLPTTLPAGMWYLDCGQNNLTTLPSLPPGFYNLSCSSNQLTSLPTLPNGLAILFCNNNNISCMPVFPASLNNPGNFAIHNNPFTCLPNYVAAMDAGTLAKPLCVFGDMVNNNAGCASAQGIVGTTYKNVIAPATYNTGDIALANISLSVSGATGGQTISASNGVYSFPVTTTGSYLVKVETAGTPYTVQGTNPATVVVGSGATTQDFAITCSGLDLGTYSVVDKGLVFPGQPHDLEFVTGDLSKWFGLNCSTGIGGQVVITVTGPVTYTSPAPLALTPTSIVGTTFTYAIPDYSALDISTAFGLTLRTNNTAQTGDDVCVNVKVTPTNLDIHPANNNYTYCYPVVNSFDPNDKQTYPDTVAPGYHDYFTYTIHFQNTGNAPAINIQLEDVLDANLDLSTFEVINHSHPVTSLLNGNQLTFNFSNIFLPDSTSNRVGSEGFVQYKIKPLAGLPSGTNIHNTASIYFDFNAPVVTNTTVNRFLLVSGIHSNLLPDAVSIYPNPTTGHFIVSISKEEGTRSLDIYNVLGEMVYQSEIGNENTSHGTIMTEVDLSGNDPGIYFLNIFDGDHIVRFSGKLVKE